MGDYCSGLLIRSTVSAYGLGAIADNGGWDAAFYLLLGACGVGIVIGAVYIIFSRAKKNS
ncbi:MAG: MFS transporter [Ruminococcaceae bacterium]|nr:MFS transporter [Oscillospiraceae bacterium]